jgi:hypothetical protein
LIVSLLLSTRRRRWILAAVILAVATAPWSTPGTLLSLYRRLTAGLILIPTPVSIPFPLA